MRLGRLWLTLVALMLVTGCGTRVAGTLAPQGARGESKAARTALLAPEAWVFACRNLPGYPDTVLGVAPTNIPGRLPSDPPLALHPELLLLGVTGGAITETDPDGNVEAYLYPFELFPAGSRFRKYAVTGALLCADVNASGVGAPLQLHATGLVFAGRALANTEEARNLPFTRYGARLVIGETDRATWINGLHLMLPGKGEVWLSHAAR